MKPVGTTEYVVEALRADGRPYARPLFYAASWTWVGGLTRAYRYRYRHAAQFDADYCTGPPGDHARVRAVRVTLEMLPVGDTE